MATSHSVEMASENGIVEGASDMAGKCVFLSAPHKKNLAASGSGRRAFRVLFPAILMHSPTESRAARVQVAIIGGGPAGSVAAARLAQLGVSALVVERERFPRFHIGESLLPNGNNVLKRIGVWEKIQAAGFVEKRAAQFTLPDRSQTVRNVFADGIVPGMGVTYQVERARFDEILLRHAESCGAEVWEEARVADAERVGSGWAITVERGGSSERVEAGWIIDASGRNCVMGRALRLPREELPYPGRLAAFNHFENVPRDAGEAAGDIVVVRLEDAWFWVIPISDTVTSIGVVLQKGSGRKAGESLEAVFWRKVGESSFLSDLLSAAVAKGAFRQESDYSFSYSIFGAQRALLAGDAASFIDPVFSSGVYLALESGLLAADSVADCLARPERATRIYETYTQAMKSRVGEMRKLIDTYYDNDAFEVFMTPRPRLDAARGINSILAGCLNPPLRVRWRLWLFGKICQLHKRRSIVPRVGWKSLATPGAPAARRPTEPRVLASEKAARAD